MRHQQSFAGIAINNNLSRCASAVMLIMRDEGPRPFFQTRFVQCHRLLVFWDGVKTTLWPSRGRSRVRLDKHHFVLPALVCRARAIAPRFEVLAAIT